MTRMADTCNTRNVYAIYYYYIISVPTCYYYYFFFVVSTHTHSLWIGIIIWKSYTTDGARRYNNISIIIINFAFDTRWKTLTAALPYRANSALRVPANYFIIFRTYPLLSVKMYRGRKKGASVTTSARGCWSRRPHDNDGDCDTNCVFVMIIFIRYYNIVKSFVYSTCLCTKLKKTVFSGILPTCLSYTGA